jgi:hypothetical protein
VTDAERLRLRCRQSPAWAAAEIERLRALLSRAGIEPADGQAESDPAG